MNHLHNSNDGSREPMDGLTSEEVKIIQSTIELKDLFVEDIMIGIDKLWAVNVDELITTPFLYNVYKRGFSKIPVYKDEKRNIIGIISTKFLITASEYMGKPVGKAVKVTKPVYVAKDQNLLELLKIFQTSKTTCALITDKTVRPNEIRGSIRRTFHSRPEGFKEDTYNIIGMITLKDLFAKICSVELMDNDDHYYSVVGFWYPR